nr:unnamed protein product [Spirometra erinaceieuropaei]
MRTHLYSTFVDLMKAFDTVNREGLWKIMLKFGCPERFTQMVHQLHDGMMARVTNNGAVSEAFAVTNGVKQGCVLAPTLFILMYSAMLMDAYRDERPGIRIAYRTEGHLLNQRRMNFQSRVSKTYVHELLIADDCALNTTSEEEMQRSMDLFTAACENFGLVINTQKTVVMHQPPPNSVTAPNAPPQISVNGTQLQVVKNFRTWARNAKPANPNCAQSVTPPHNLFQRVRDVSRHSGLESALLDIFGSTVTLQLHKPCPPARLILVLSAAKLLWQFFCTTTATTAATQAAVLHINNRDTTTGTTPASPDSSYENQDYTCPHCDRTFTSRIGLVGQLRIHRPETGEPVPGAPTYTHRTRLHCPHCLAPSRIAWVYSATCASSRVELTEIPARQSHPSCPAPPSLRPSAPPPTPRLWLTLTPPNPHVHTVHAHSPHASAWSVICESIAQRPENQCLEHQPTPTKLDSTAHTALALSGTTWAYSATCASTTTCGRQPPVTPHIHTLPTLLHHQQHTSTPTHRMHQLPPSTQVGNVHLDSVPMRFRLHG